MKKFMVSLGNHDMQTIDIHTHTKCNNNVCIKMQALNMTAFSDTEKKEKFYPWFDCSGVPQCPITSSHVLSIVSLQQVNNFILQKSGGQLKCIPFIGGEPKSKGKKIKCIKITRQVKKFEAVTLLDFRFPLSQNSS